MGPRSPSIEGEVDTGSHPQSCKLLRPASRDGEKADIGVAIRTRMAFAWKHDGCSPRSAIEACAGEGVTEDANARDPAQWLVRRSYALAIRHP